MPALDWRIIPARSISRCETICASLGFSRSNGRKYSERRIGSRLLEVAAQSREQAGDCPPRVPVDERRRRLRKIHVTEPCARATSGATGTRGQPRWPKFREGPSAESGAK